jgi:hypothetical protein
MQADITDEDYVMVSEHDRHMADAIYYCIDIGTNNRKLNAKQRGAIRKLVNNLVAEAHIKLALMGFDRAVVSLEAAERSPRWGTSPIHPEGMED